MIEDEGKQTAGKEQGPQPLMQEVETVREDEARAEHTSYVGSRQDEGYEVSRYH